MGYYRKGSSLALRRHLRRVSPLGNQARKENQKPVIPGGTSSSAQRAGRAGTESTEHNAPSLHQRVHKATEGATQKWKGIVAKAKSQFYNANKTIRRLRSKLKAENSTGGQQDNTCTCQPEETANINTRNTLTTSITPNTATSIIDSSSAGHVHCCEACVHNAANILRLNKQRVRLLKVKNALRPTAEISPSIPAKAGGGVISPKARWMIRSLVAIGVPHRKVYSVCQVVCEATQTRVKGAFDAHSVTRIVREGYVAAAVQAVHKVHQAESWTGSADGTGHKHVEHLAHHVYVRVPTYTNPTSNPITDPSVPCEDSPSSAQSPNRMPLQQRFLGVRPVTDKLSETQLNAFQDLLGKFEWKRILDREKRGEATLYTWAQSAPAQFLAYLLQVGEDMVRSAGGQEMWDKLSQEEQEAHAIPILHKLKVDLGETAFAELSPEDQTLIDQFDLNFVKGGNTALQEFWKAATYTEPPIPLPSRDNAAVISVDAESSAGQHAVTVSQGGAVKLVQLCGLVFNHHDDKKGQQDTYRNFFEQTLSYVVRFSETSNTGFQSHCVAACELLVHLPLYIAFLDLVRDKKEKRSLNNIEKNIYQGLHDTPTLTELAVLALYAQAISHPYMRVVRGNGNWNALMLGPFHHQLMAHCETIIENPDVLLAPDASYVMGALDGAQWERPEAYYAVQRMAPTLPYLREALVAFMKGALETWRRFCREFAEDGRIATLSSAKRERIAVCATNDANESQLGRKRVMQRRAPNKSELTHNAEVMYATNGTADFIATYLDTQEGQAFLRRAGRALDESKREQKVRETLVNHDKRVVEAKHRKDAVNREKADKRNEKLDKVQPILDVEELARWKEDKRITIAQHIDPQLQWHKRDNSKGVKMAGNQAQKIDALIAVVTVYQLRQGAQREQSDVEALAQTERRKVDELDYISDCEDREEKLLHD
ncbi:hypothetical protein K474DRAFT_1676080 [Panus rudis PR-1116 ss-1]|nr:hypothetical protein K474DRAFT_1676080 [Panus rudis PR-1116 ss-1]